MPKRLRTFNRLDGEKVSALFVDSFRDIKNLGHCPVCLGGCLMAFCHSSSLGSYVSPENIAILREHHHPLLDSCMLFLTMERPLDEMTGFGGNSSSWINCMPLRFQQPFNSGITHRYTSHATHRFLHRQVGLHRLLVPSTTRKEGKPQRAQS